MCKEDDKDDSYLAGQEQEATLPQTISSEEEPVPEGIRSGRRWPTPPQKDKKDPAAPPGASQAQEEQQDEARIDITTINATSWSSYKPHGGTS